MDGLVDRLEVPVSRCWDALCHFSSMRNRHFPPQRALPYHSISPLRAMTPALVHAPIPVPYAAL